ncbi:protein antagonist of like heterochromatin protein 1 [Plakobranchus ocellatus]|uniref:Protein antagonist of like heterochromatin protein 1 n=1 Tax=Plakobranchus ocellatus TaxID=259542 RepID=A0AAV4AKK1_9GAST|nr:protein antagonist of like heterochromatin protein 1 [Plakobranchus ocellatus]
MLCTQQTRFNNTRLGHIDKMATSFERDFLMLDGCLSKFLLASNTRRIGVHEINQGRRENGEYHHLFHQLKRHPEQFHSYMRMSVDTFDYILKTVESKLMKSWNNWHEPILPEERLVVTLKFIAIDVGGYGIQSDGGTFQASNLYRAILGGKIQIPEPRTLPKTNVVAPFVFVADEAYPLMDFLLKPYGRGNLSLEEECFNKRLSRSRKTVECAFGILVLKWGILDKPIKADTELVDRIVKCVCILRNVIIDKDGMDHNYTKTEQTRSDSSVMWNRCGRPSNEAKTTRDIFTAYFSQQPLEYRES